MPGAVTQSAKVAGALATAVLLAAIGSELSEELGRAFADDIGLLSELLGRDLSHWVA